MGIFYNKEFLFTHSYSLTCFKQINVSSPHYLIDEQSTFALEEHKGIQRVTANVQASRRKVSRTKLDHFRPMLLKNVLHQPAQTLGITNSYIVKFYMQQYKGE